MTVTLHGPLGLIVAFLACAGASTILCGIWDWLADRFRADLRHVRIHRRWDRPGAHVTFQGGRRAIVSEVFFDRLAGGMAIVCPYHDEGDCFQPEWVSLGDLSPLRRPAAKSALPAEEGTS
jgi:hypothetical protein